MTRIRKDTKANITIINNTVVRDADLSWKARGIFVYLWSLPEDWDFYESEITKHATDGKDSTRTGLHELEDKGYLTRTRARDDKGRLHSSIWVLHENPHPKSKKPNSKNRNQDKSNLDNPQLLNTNITKHEHNKTLTKQNKGTEDKPPVHPPYKEIISYLNEKSGNAYHHTTKKYRGFIHARYAEGFTLDDFKKVIDFKTQEWLHNSKMEKYLRPETLFSGNFDKYLNAAKKANKNSKPVYDFTSEEWQAKTTDNFADDLPF